MSAQEKLETVLAQRPLGLVFDIDGTLSPIAPTPEQAQLYPGIVELLQQAKAYAHVAIMTGRAINDGAAKVNVDGLTYIGTHGMEWSDGLPGLHEVHVVTEALDYQAPGTYLLDLVEQQLPGLPGVIVQRKLVGGSIHYRLAPDHPRVRQKLLTILDEPARRLNMRVSEGKQVIEIRPPLAIDKGRALREFAQRCNARGMLFAGDDLTDLDAILEIANLRQQGIAALGIAVRHPDTPAEMLQHADIVADGVPGMATLLGEIVETLAKQDNGQEVTS